MIADERQGIAHEGSAPNTCADARPAAAAITIIEAFILTLSFSLISNSLSMR